MITINVHADVTVTMCDPALLQRLSAVELQATQLAAKGIEAAMADERVNVRLDELNAVTNELAAEFEALRDAIVNGTVDDAQIARFDAGIAGLRAIGSNSANPIPSAARPGKVGDDRVTGPSGPPPKVGGGHVVGDPPRK